MRGGLSRSLAGALVGAVVGVCCADTDRLVSGHGANPSDAAAPPAESDAGPCSQDLLTDPRNCGRCGHDCLGGACKEGQCQPVAIATAQVEPALAGLDATSVYWTTGNDVMGVPKNGGTVVKLVRPDEATYGVCMLLDVTGPSGALCITNPTNPFPQYSLFRLDKAGGEPERIRALSIPLGAPTTADAAAVYGFGAGAVIVLPRDGSPERALVSLDGHHTMRGLAVTNTHVYWAEAPATPSFTDARVLEVPKITDAGTPTAEIVATVFEESGSIDSQTAIEHLTSDGQVLYFLQSRSGTVQRIDPAAQRPVTPVIVASGINVPRALAVDAANVYFVNQKDEIYACPKTGCGANHTLLASSQARVVGFAVDATALYWAASDSGSIMRLAK